MGEALAIELFMLLIILLFLAALALVVWLGYAMMKGQV